MVDKEPDEKTLEFRRVKDAMKQLVSWDDVEVKKLCQIIFPYMTEHYRKSVSLEAECEKLITERNKLKERIDAYANACKRLDAEIARLHIAYSVGSAGS